MNLLELKERVCQVAKLASDFIANQRKCFDSTKIEHKGHQNLVSYVDKQAERLIVEQLQGLIPGCDFLGEEGTSTNNGSPYRWVIDPLDGTTNFIHDFPPYCVSIALEYEGEVVLGVIYVVTSGECFAATKDTPATLNGREIRVSDVDRIENSLVISGLAYDHSCQFISEFTLLFERFNRTTNGARRVGSAAANLAYIACGRAECFYQTNLSPWDVAAGGLIIQQAGGVVVDFDGGGNFVYGKSIIATNQKLHAEFYKKIQEK